MVSHWDPSAGWERAGWSPPKALEANLSSVPQEAASPASWAPLFTATTSSGLPIPVQGALAEGHGSFSWGSPRTSLSTRFGKGQLCPPPAWRPLVPHHPCTTEQRGWKAMKREKKGSEQRYPPSLSVSRKGALLCTIRLGDLAVI